MIAPLPQAIPPFGALHLDGYQRELAITGTLCFGLSYSLIWINAKLYLQVVKGNIIHNFVEGEVKHGDLLLCHG